MPRFLLCATLLLLLTLQVSTASAETVLVWANKDNTLYKQNKGIYSNGSGQFIIAGHAGNARDVRRGLVSFPVADSVSAGSTILNVQLVLYVSQVFYLDPRVVRLHPLLQDWGEGASDARGYELSGAIAEPGDATWIHTFYDTALWSHGGGNWIRGEDSASLTVDGYGFFTWTSAKMVADVQRWLDDPGSNFGWLLAGDESRLSTPTTAKFFNSSEHRDRSLRPVIRVEFERGVQTHDRTWGYIKAFWR